MDHTVFHQRTMCRAFEADGAVVQLYTYIHDVPSSNPTRLGPSEQTILEVVHPPGGVTEEIGARESYNHVIPERSGVFIGFLEAISK